MYNYIILTMVVAGALSVNSFCPDVTAVRNFDINAYANGRWFELGRYPNRAEGSGNCGAANYQLVGNFFYVNNTDVDWNRLRFISGTARLADDAYGTGKLTFTYPYGVGGSNMDATLWILDTDYVNYSVVFHCSYDPIRQVRQDLAWVLSRSKVLNAAARAGIQRVLYNSGVIDSSRLIWPDFSDPACTYFN